MIILILIILIILLIIEIFIETVLRDPLTFRFKFNTGTVSDFHSHSVIPQTISPFSYPNFPVNFNILTKRSVNNLQFTPKMYV